MLFVGFCAWAVFSITSQVKQFITVFMGSLTCSFFLSQCAELYV